MLWISQYFPKYLQHTSYSSQWGQDMGCLFRLQSLFCLNSLWPNDTIWWQRSGSTLAQVKVITWTKVDLPSVRSIGIHLSTILQDILQPSITKISWKITFLKFLWNLPGVNELIGHYIQDCFIFDCAIMTSDCLLDPYYMWAIYSNVCAYNQYTYAAMPISLFLNWPYQKSSHLSIKNLIHMICHLRIDVSEACLKSQAGYWHIQPETWDWPLTIINNLILGIESLKSWLVSGWASDMLPNPGLWNLAQMITHFFAVA